ncbi:protein OPI10 homolog isoform X1 [Cajanus cajan]|uniref:protein OPI10 homolog isoform X1 n=1 Tax=Cajanus cajan TaxID=3821 RepID=UPI00098DD612|nr:protein OPI10 homolog isoform X1 [Cajanus cajan]
MTHDVSFFPFESIILESREEHSTGVTANLNQHQHQHRIASNSQHVRSSFPQPELPHGHLNLRSNRHLPLAPRHEHFREAYDQVRELCIFLLNGLTLPPEKALAVYIQSPGSPFVFCGAVTVARPSAVLPLAWPEPGAAGPLQLTADAQPLSAKIGVSVEDLASLPSLDAMAEKRIEGLAMKVGENLFNFMQSFCGVDGSKLVVPMDILDRWFKKFQERAKRDPEYLKGFAL